jgi:hypothetical protein
MCVSIVLSVSILLLTMLARYQGNLYNFLVVGGFSGSLVFRLLSFPMPFYELYGLIGLCMAGVGLYAYTPSRQKNALATKDSWFYFPFYYLASGFLVWVVVVSLDILMHGFQINMANVGGRSPVKHDFFIVLEKLVLVGVWSVIPFVVAFKFSFLPSPFVKLFQWACALSAIGFLCAGSIIFAFSFQSLFEQFITVLL